MSKSFMFKGTECVRQLICFSQDTKVFDLDKEAQVFGVNDNIDSESAYRQLNAEIQPNLIQNLVKFWTASPEIKFRYLLISFQKFVGRESKNFTNDAEFRKSVINLFIALFQQILIEIGPRVIKKTPIATILRVTVISNSSNLVKALRKFDIPYQKSLISQDTMGYVNKNISEASSSEYKNVVEELINLLTINIK